jgi:hypothetical protein
VAHRSVPLLATLTLSAALAHRVETSAQSSNRNAQLSDGMMRLFVRGTEQVEKSVGAKYARAQLQVVIRSVVDKARSTSVARKAN